MKSQNKHTAVTGGGQTVPERKQKAKVKQERKSQRPQQGQRSSLVPSSAAAAQDIDHALSVEIQQAILDVFQHAFAAVLQQQDFRVLVQEVKGHLYNRDFPAAFSKQAYLDVYALRWSAARALAYAHLFTHPDRLVWFETVKHTSSSGEILTAATRGTAAEPSISDVPDVSTGPEAKSILDTAATDISASLVTKPERFSSSSMLTEDRSIHPASGQSRVVCVGGGAGAEIVAFAAVSQYLGSVRCPVSYQDQPVSRAKSPVQFDIHAIDVADWREPVRKLSGALTSLLPLPHYASGITHDADRVVLDPDTSHGPSISFDRQDVLQTSCELLKETLRNVSLITIMFTLNELFGSSLPKTTAFLLNLTEATETGARLLVVDSPGSYSEVTIGKTGQTKKYPMKWLLDHTLLEVAGKGRDARWLKVEDNDSQWFRLDDKLGLKYDVQLENCRYQIHVFEKLK